jgi:hypothetical protein
MSASVSACRDVLQEGQRVGRYVILRDIEGTMLAVAPGSIGAVCETEDGAMLMLPGGRMTHIPRPFAVVLGWLDGRG